MTYHSRLQDSFSRNESIVSNHSQDIHTPSYIKTVYHDKVTRPSYKFSSRNSDGNDSEFNPYTVNKVQHSTKTSKNDHTVLKTTTTRTGSVSNKSIEPTIIRPDTSKDYRPESSQRSRKRSSPSDSSSSTSYRISSI